MTPFQQGMQFIALHEWGNMPDGRYHNDPADPGGETKFGISKRAFPNEDIKGLSLQRAFEIYNQCYWGIHGLNNVDLPMCIAYFDSYVQHNPTVVKRLIEQGQGDLRQFIEARRLFYKQLERKNPGLEKFDRGWMNRLNDLSKYCSIVLQEQQQK